MDFTGMRTPADTGVGFCEPDTSGAPAPSPCQACAARRDCVGQAIRSAATHAQPLIGQRRVRRGDIVVRSGDPFRYTWAVHSGVFKSSLPLADGREQVAAFHFPGELMGVDGHATGRHAATVVALEDGNVCAFPFSLLAEATAHRQDLRERMWSLMVTELMREREMVTLLASSSAEQRIAAFLVGLGDRLRSRGYSPREFYLRMSRRDIASHLGMTVETVCRTLASLDEQGVIESRKKHISILKPEQLERQSPPAMRSPVFAQVSLV